MITLPAYNYPYYNNQFYGNKPNSTANISYDCYNTTKTPPVINSLIPEKKCSSKEIEQMMLKLIEYRNINLKAHTIAVAMYSDALAKASGCSKQEIEQVRTAGLLHDVGKIETNDRYFSGERNDELVRINRDHIIRGYNILSNVDCFKGVVANVALKRHENLDGSGYLKLKGNQIDKITRIVTIADCFDAETRSRYPGETPYNLDKGLEELKNKRGSRLDPQLVDIFVETIKRDNNALYKKVSMISASGQYPF